MARTKTHTQTAQKHAEIQDATDIQNKIRFVLFLLYKKHIIFYIRFLYLIFPRNFIVEKSQ